MALNKKLQLFKDKQDHIFTRASGILGIFAAPVRMKLIHFLTQAPLTVEVISQKIDESIANTSMHLRKMLNENLVKVGTVGQKRLYSLHPSVFNFWEKSQDFIQSIDPSLGFIESDDKEEELNWKHSIDETIKLLNQKQVIFLDVRPEDESNHSHKDNKNIICIPSTDLNKKLELLPKKKKMLVICRGRMCALSVYTVNYLRENNFNAFRFDQSWFAIEQSLSKRKKK